MSSYVNNFRIMVKKNRNQAAAGESSSDSEEDFSKVKWKRKVKVTQAIEDAVYSSDLDSVKNHGTTMNDHDFIKNDWRLNSRCCTVALPILNNLSGKELKVKIVDTNNCERQILKAKASKRNARPKKSPASIKSAINKNLHSATKRKCSDSEDEFQEKKNRTLQNVFGNVADFFCCKMKSGDNMLRLEEYELLENTEFTHDGSSEHPAYKLDNFSCYCRREHLCSILNWTFDEDNAVFLQGEVKRLCSDENSAGLYISKIGPINYITFSGYDNGEKVLVIISTDFAQYYLLEPSVDYASFYRPLLRSALLFKYTVELLLSDRYATYDDLVEKIENVQPSYGLEPFKPDDLLESVTFIIDEIINYDSATTEKDEKLATTRCIKRLAEISGISEDCTKVNQNEVRRRRPVIDIPKQVPVKATTTPLIHHIMQICDIFQQQISPESSAMQLKESDSEESDNEEETTNISLKNPVINIKRMHINKNSFICQPNTKSFEWLDSPKSVNGKDNVHYSMILKGIKYNANDFVLLNSNSEGSSFVKIVYMFENKKGKQFHGHYFCLGNQTILGNMAAKKELYMINSCDNLRVNTIMEKVTVIYNKPSDNWRLNGGLRYSGFKDSDAYFYQQWYEEPLARFVDPPVHPDIANRDHSCISCFVKNLKIKELIPMVTRDKALWQGKEYHVGDCVYVQSKKNISKRMEDLCVPPKLNPNIDEDIYPEYYRKSGGSARGMFINVPRPFLIGRIIGFKGVSNGPQSAKDFKVKLQIFWRPEKTNLPIKDIYKMDYNLLFWTGSEQTFNLNEIVRKCCVIYGGQLKKSNLLDDYFVGGPDRFYFLESYDPSKKTTFAVANKIQDQFSKDGSKFEPYPIVSKKLKALDVFCGCGGLSEGFHQSGLTETKWAIENDAIAAKAFQKNNPKAIVYTGDCNAILKQMIEGKTFKGKKLPQKGEVEFLKGGPPCQGFSGMNRFKKGELSLFKNSLIATYLSYVDYLRPRFFLLENVRAFVSYKKGAVLKSCLRSLREMDYQVTVGILEAGNYGIPQTRTRAFILAAAPNEKLPYFPDPIHTFLSRESIHFTVDGITYKSNNWEKTSAPFRQLTVYDGISDLAAINEDEKREKFYDANSQTHFQRMMRRGCKTDKIYDHTSKVPSCINKERYKLIPKEVGADWRDLPNICMKLSNGTLTEKLKYEFEDKNESRSKTGAKRGVCSCAGDRKKVHKRQTQVTLIPWCLPHTSDTHNDWTGLFGRLLWYGYFGTTITNPGPMGKCGMVLHPEEDRVVSVRECARSQGFPDSYKFSGRTLNRHRQIGNAVPPPLAKAIGLQFIKCLKEA